MIYTNRKEFIPQCHLVLHKSASKYKTAIVCRLLPTTCIVAFAYPFRDFLGKLGCKSFND